jgi:hypothetical protein
MPARRNWRRMRAAIKVLKSSSTIPASRSIMMKLLVEDYLKSRPRNLPNFF